MKSLEEAVSNARMGKDGKQVAQTDVDWHRFTRFLETGQLNWEVTDKDFGPTELLEKLLETQPDRLKAFLPQLLGNRKAMERLSLQFRPAILWRWMDLLERIDPQIKSKLLESLGILRILWPHLPSGARSEALVMQILLVWQAQRLKNDRNSLSLPENSGQIQVFIQFWLGFLQNAQLSPSKFQIDAVSGALQGLSWESFEAFVSKMDQGAGAAWNVLRQALKSDPILLSAVSRYLPLALESVLLAQKKAQYNFLSEILPHLRTAIETEMAELPKASQQKWAQLFEENAIPKAKPIKSSKAGGQKDIKKQSANDQGSDSIDAEGIYISNAGLVLLNPFFQHCFEGLGWMEKGEWCDEASQENAVMLLAFMASGEEEVAETMLPLPKLLCGMALDEPVRMQTELTDAAKAEADNLLTAANQYWEKAGKLNPDQFRSAFLQREAKLEQIESGWNLKVDRQTIDILIEFIPWGFGTIMLKWMRGLLTVDW
jgi:hypothetical protein